MEIMELLKTRVTYVGAVAGAIVMMVPGFFLGIMIGTQIGAAWLQEFADRVAGPQAPNMMWIGLGLTFLLVMIICVAVGAIAGGAVGVLVSYFWPRVRS